MNINKKKLFILPFIFSVFMMLCGCTYQEVHEKAYLRNISVAGDDIKTVFMNFYNEDLSPAKTENNNFESILKNSEILSGKSIFTGHTEVIILGECNYIETLRYILEEWKVSPSCLIVYGGKNSGDIIENSDSDTLADILRTAVKQKRIPKNDIITVLSSLLKDNKAEIPLITSDGNLDKIIIS